MYTHYTDYNFGNRNRLPLSQIEKSNLLCVTETYSVVRNRIRYSKIEKCWVNFKNL